MPACHFTVTVHRRFATRDGVAIEWTMSGTHVGNYPDSPATGRPFAVRGATIMQLVDGKVMHDIAY
jgi:SnoaL-like polyketide cyclase